MDVLSKKNYPQQLAPESRTKKIGRDKLKGSIEELGARTKSEKHVLRKQALKVIQIQYDSFFKLKNIFVARKYHLS